MSTLNEALSLLEAGDWQAAHPIVQADSSHLGSWAHAVVHIQEGDLANANYWLRRCGREEIRDTCAATMREELGLLIAAAAG